MDEYRNETLEYRAGEEIAVARQRSFINRVYGWMCFGLLLTGGIAYLTAGSERLLKFLFANQFNFLILVLLELGTVIFLTAAIRKISAATALFGFCLYAALNGLTFSAILLAYAQSSVVNAFLTTAGTFGAMSLFGVLTKKDLTGLGAFFSMALVGLLIAMVVNLFMQSGQFDFIISIIGVIVFVGLTAYDAQKIKRLSEAAATGEIDAETEGKGAIMGALTLYLDFINLFLFLLRLFGGNRK